MEIKVGDRVRVKESAGGNRGERTGKVVHTDIINFGKDQVLWVRPDVEVNSCLYVFAKECALLDEEAAPEMNASSHIMGISPEEIDMEAYREFMRGL